MDKLKFIIPGKPEYLTMVRLAISSVATTASFDLDAIEDIKTSVSEGCKFVSCHGFAGFSDEFQVTCSVDKGYLEITIKDECGTHGLTKGVHQTCKCCPQEGDIGVFVIESLMDEVEFTNDGKGRKTIRMVKRL